MYCDLWSQYIQVRKLFKGGNYSRAETIRGNTISIFLYLKLKLPNWYCNKIIGEVINQPLPILLSTSHGTSHSVVCVSSYGVVQKLCWQDLGHFWPPDLAWQQQNTVLAVSDPAGVKYKSLFRYSVCATYIEVLFSKVGTVWHSSGKWYCRLS